MAHAQKPDFVFPRNGRVHLNRWGRQFSRLLVADVCASAWVMLDTPCSEVAWEYWLPTPFASFPFTSPPVLHRVPPGSERALILDWRNYRGISSLSTTGIRLRNIFFSGVSSIRRRNYWGSSLWITAKCITIDGRCLTCLLFNKVRRDSLLPLTLVFASNYAKAVKGEWNL